MMPATVQRVAFGVRAHTPALRVNKHHDQAVDPASQHTTQGLENTSRDAAGCCFSPELKAVWLLFKMENAHCMNTGRSH